MKRKAAATPEARLAEAERRIEEARRTRAEWLDLGDLELQELPASLGELPHLSALYLGAWGPEEDGELDWHDYEPAFTNLAPLASLQALQSLNLSFCTGLTELQSLAN